MVQESFGSGRPSSSDDIPPCFGIGVKLLAVSGPS